MNRKPKICEEQNLENPKPGQEMRVDREVVLEAVQQDQHSFTINLRSWELPSA